MTNKGKRGDTYKAQPGDKKPIILAPLDFEEALSGPIEAGPHPQRTEGHRGAKRKRRKNAQAQDGE